MKVICNECNWHGLEKELLKGINPFNKEEEDVVFGCPKCKNVNSTSCACDEKDCWKHISCGTPTKNGYRNTCGNHKPCPVV